MRLLHVWVIAATFGLWPACGNQKQTSAAMPMVQPQELVRVLRGSGERPLLLHVGFKKLYEQAHIAGSEYVGPGNEQEGLDRLRKRVAALPPAAPMVVYCGCCPWVRCPNVEPVMKTLRAMGFSNVKALYIEEDFGADWVAKGYPVESGG